jgi:copper(I)-binding protein
MLEALAALSKTALYAAAFSGAGIPLAHASLAREGRAEGDALARQVGRAAGVLLVAAAIASAAILVMRLGGYWDLGTLSAIFLSPLGAGLALHCAGGLGLVLSARRWPAVASAILILAGFALSGHAAARSPVLAAVMMTHLAAACWWLGGLLLLLRGSDRLPLEQFKTLVVRFSTLAIWIVAGLFIAGALTAAFLLSFSPDLSRSYDRALLLKAAIALAVLALAAVNKFVLTPRAFHSGGVSWLRGAIRAELVLIAGVLVATAFMTTYLSPHERHAAPPQRVAAEVEGIAVIEPWASVTPGGVSLSAGYFILRNGGGDADRLLSASSPRAARVTLHEMSMEGDMMRMRSLGPVDIPVRGEVVFAPGVAHLMFEGVTAPFWEGEVIPVTLHFERRGEVRVDFPVQSGASAQGVHGGH